MRAVTVILTLFTRELKGYFFSPIAYVVAGIFFFLNGIVFGVTLQTRVLVTDELFNPIAVILLFIIPLVSMRLLSEELRSGTIESLLTDPVRTWEVVVGKYLGGLVFVALLLLPLAVFCLFIHNLGQDHGGLDPGPVLTGMLGIFLLSAAALGLGILFSAATCNQIVAGVLTFMAFLFLCWIDDVGQVMGGQSVFLQEATEYLSLSSHILKFFRGQILWQDVLYFSKVVFISLFLTGLVLDSRKWR